MKALNRKISKATEEEPVDIMYWITWDIHMPRKVQGIIYKDKNGDKKIRFIDKDGDRVKGHKWYFHVWDEEVFNELLKLKEEYDVLLKRKRVIENKIKEASTLLVKKE